MSELAKDPAVTDTADLLTHYSFDLGGYTVEQLLDRWLRGYPLSWLRSAVIEALYQGRYKAVSVEQILTLWRRRGHSLQHFNHEFERIICGRFPKTLIDIATSKPEARVEKDKPQPQGISENETLPDTAVSTALDSSEQELKQKLEHSLERAMPAAEVEAAAIAPQKPLPPSSAVNLHPSLDLIPALKPDLSPTFDKTELILWSKAQGSKLPIHQFVPAPATSDFYTKLKAVAHSVGTR